MPWTQDRADQYAIELAYRGYDRETQIRQAAGNVLAGHYTEIDDTVHGRQVVVHFTISPDRRAEQITVRRPQIGPVWAQRQAVEAQLREALDQLERPRRRAKITAYYCEADEDFHDAHADPQTGMCPMCTAPPRAL